MVRFVSIALTLATFSGISARPVSIQKRVAQVITDATRDWEQACITAGGGQACNPVSVQSFSTLLAAPGPCAQQDAADAMINLAKQLGGDKEMIRLAQLFRQQPRNAPDSLSVRYCQNAPQNSELNGLFNCQFAGVNLAVFTGGLAVGEPGTIPFGLRAPLSPAGSCPASRTPIPDGQQLNKLVTAPGIPTPSDNAVPGDATNKPTASTTTVTKVTPTPSAPAGRPEQPGQAGGNVPFAVQNGRDADALNKQFAGLSATSPCNDGDQACIGGGFAQCVAKKFVIQSCGGGLQCFVLPLVNKPGTSLTCTTAADAQDRIARAIGTAGGAPSPPPVTSPAVNPPATSDRPATAAPATPPAAPAGAKPFTLANGLEAQAQNRKFAALDENSTCSPGDNACVNGGFAQCVGQKFVVTGCAGGLVCASLPLVNSPGTSITCTTPADVIARIAATGASASATGA